MGEKDHDIKRLFEPRGVAVIGASHDESKLGYRIVRNILSGGYAGKVYPINPRGGAILGVPVWKTIEEVEDVPDIVSVIII